MICADRKGLGREATILPSRHEECYSRALLAEEHLEVIQLPRSGRCRRLRPGSRRLHAEQLVRQPPELGHVMQALSSLSEAFLLNLRIESMPYPLLNSSITVQVCLAIVLASTGDHVLGALRGGP